MSGALTSLPLVAGDFFAFVDVADVLVEPAAEGVGGDEVFVFGGGDAEVLVDAAAVELDFEDLVFRGVADAGEGGGPDSGALHGRIMRYVG